MQPKNTICLWFDHDAHGAARFYAATFPDSKVTAVHKAPSDYPGGKSGDELTVKKIDIATIEAARRAREEEDRSYSPLVASVSNSTHRE